MAGNNSIQLLRGNNIGGSTEVLLAGQPCYDLSTNRLYVGNGTSQIKDLTPVNAYDAQTLGGFSSEDYALKSYVNTQLNTKLTNYASKTYVTSKFEQFEWDDALVCYPDIGSYTLSIDLQHPQFNGYDCVVTIEGLAVSTFEVTILGPNEHVENVSKIIIENTPITEGWFRMYFYNNAGNRITSVLNDEVQSTLKLDWTDSDGYTAFMMRIHKITDYQLPDV